MTAWLFWVNTFNRVRVCSYPFFNGRLLQGNDNHERIFILLISIWVLLEKKMTKIICSSVNRMNFEIWIWILNEFQILKWNMIESFCNRFQINSPETFEEGIFSKCFVFVCFNSKWKKSSKSVVKVMLVNVSKYSNLSKLSNLIIWFELGRLARPIEQNQSQNMSERRISLDLYTVDLIHTWKYSRTSLRSCRNSCAFGSSRQ